MTESKAFFEAAEDVYVAVKKAYANVPDNLKPQIYTALLDVVVSYSFAFAVKELLSDRAGGAEVPLDGVGEEGYSKLLNEVSGYIERSIANTPGPSGVSDMRRAIALAFSLGAKTRTVLDRELADIPGPPETQDASDPSKF